MKATNQELLGMPIYIDDDLCIVPNYKVSQAFCRTSPHLAYDLQQWANERFGTKHHVFEVNMEYLDLNATEGKALIMSSKAFGRAFRQAALDALMGQ